MVYIWLRSTLDWQDEAAFRAQLPPRLVAPVALWNSHFRLPYHLFRHRLREIAQLTIDRVEGAICARWEAIPDGGLVVPVDDDDWFAPALATTLAREYTDEFTAYVWPGNFLEVPVHLRHQLGRIRRRIFPATPARFLCTTNNYALVKHPQLQPLCRKHTAASDWCRAHLSRVRILEEPLSLMNRTLASTTSLRNKRPPFAAQKMQLARYRYRLLYAAPADPSLAWSQPYREMMAALLAEL